MEAQPELIWSWLFCLEFNVVAFGNITSLENCAWWERVSHWSQNLLIFRKEYWEIFLHVGEMITALSFRAWGIYLCCNYNMLFLHSCSYNWWGLWCPCVCVCRRERALCLRKWKSICFLCWRWMLSAGQRLLALVVTVSSGQWRCKAAGTRRDKLAVAVWGQRCGSSGNLPNPKAAQSSSSGSLVCSLFLQQSLFLVLWGQNPDGNKLGPCWGAHTWAVPQDLGSLLPPAHGETLAPGQTLQTFFLFPANPGIWTPLWCQRGGNLLMVLEEIQSSTSTSQSSQSLSRCGAGGAFFVGGCTKVFQALVTSSMTNGWVGIYWEMEPSLTRAEWQPLAETEGTLWALHPAGC